MLEAGQLHGPLSQLAVQPCGNMKRKREKSELAIAKNKGGSNEKSQYESMHVDTIVPIHADTIAVGASVYS